MLNFMECTIFINKAVKNNIALQQKVVSVFKDITIQ